MSQSSPVVRVKPEGSTTRASPRASSNSRSMASLRAAFSKQSSNSNLKSPSSQDNPQAGESASKVRRSGSPRTKPPHRSPSGSSLIRRSSASSNNYTTPTRRTSSTADGRSASSAPSQRFSFSGGSRKSPTSHSTVATPTGKSYTDMMKNGSFSTPKKASTSSESGHHSSNKTPDSRHHNSPSMGSNVARRPSSRLTSRRPSESPGNHHNTSTSTTSNSNSSSSRRLRASAAHATPGVLRSASTQRTARGTRSSSSTANIRGAAGSKDLLRRPSSSASSTTDSTAPSSTKAKRPSTSLLRSAGSKTSPRSASAGRHSLSRAIASKRQSPSPSPGRTIRSAKPHSFYKSPTEESAPKPEKAQIGNDIASLQGDLENLKTEELKLKTEIEHAFKFYPREVIHKPVPSGWDVEATHFSDDGGAGDCIDTDYEDASTAFKCFPLEPDLENFKVIYGLGRGGFSSVLLVMRQHDRKLFALKVIGKNMIKESKHRKRLQVERLILQRLPANPFIAQLTVAFQTKTELFMLMDYCAGGDLCYQCFRIFSKIDRFNDSQARFYISEITLAIEHLHVHGFVHRDVKPENIMIDQTGHLKLIDFGLCKKIRSNKEMAAMVKDPQGVQFDLEPMSPCGSLAFVPPETLEQRGSFAGDWWGLGVIAFELLTGHFPWRNVGTGDDEALRMEIREGLTDLPEGLSRSATSLLRGLLEKHVPRRLGYFSANQIKSHSFFKGMDWEKALNLEYDPPFHPCRPKRVKDKDGNIKFRPEPVLGISNFGKDQRDLAFDHYTSEDARLDESAKWPVYRGFDISTGRPGTAPPPTHSPEAEPTPPPPVQDGPKPPGHVI